MTPAARLSAAMTILDRVLAGTPAEQALTNWARASRFAGSGDRHAIRDLVFDALRCRRSFAALGGGESGRGLILGGLRAAGQDPAPLFTGEGHAPAPVSAADEGRAPLPGPEELDCPDWLAPLLEASLGADFVPVMQALRQRAPIFLRVNTLRAGPEQAIAALAEDGIVATPHHLAKNALQVTDNARKIHSSHAYSSGMVELQDAASQAIVEMLPLADGMRVLDYCAGGGGKTLAMAARARLRLFAHDADPRRMRDLPERARRAGAKVTLLSTAETRAKAPYDLVLADAPCSGSGSWRRSPEGKWALTPERLQALCTVQAEILDGIAPLIAPGGVLAYATCSMLNHENIDQINALHERVQGFSAIATRFLTPLDGGDGFFVALLRRES